MTAEAVERESMDFDVVIVGAGPAGLSAAIRIKQLAAETGKDVSVVVLEKGSEVGAHILSGAVMDPKAMNELIPDWKEKGCPFETPVTQGHVPRAGQEGSIPLPVFLMPPMLHNHGMYIGSLGNVTRWMASQAEALGVEIYPGFAASDLTYREDGSIKGVIAGVMGIEKNGEPGPNYSPGMELNGKYVLIGEGVRGSLAKRLIRDFKLDKDSQPQKFGIGIKELWQVPAEQHQAGLRAAHVRLAAVATPPAAAPSCTISAIAMWRSAWWCTSTTRTRGSRRSRNSSASSITRMCSKYLEGGERISYGSRAITEGGWQSIPKLTFPGGALIGCSAGFVNLPRIKGSHNAMKTGMLAGEAAFEAVIDGRQGDELKAYAEAFKTSWVAKELKKPSATPSRCGRSSARSSASRSRGSTCGSTRCSAASRSSAR